MQQNFSGKNVLITGARGLGLELAKVWTGDNAVAITATSLASAKERAEALAAHGVHAVGLELNVTDRASIRACRAECERLFAGRLDTLVHCAGGNDPKAVLKELSQLDSDEYLDACRANEVLNSQGARETLCIFGAWMRTQQTPSSIITVGSAAAVRPLTRVLAYSGAKASAHSFSLGLAVTFAQAGSKVRVNVLVPGFFPEKQNMGLIYVDGDPLKGHTPRGQSIIGHTPMARVGVKHELASAVRFLADDEASSFVTGVVLPVDGGFTAFSGV